jgi:hypothetical protein
MGTMTYSTTLEKREAAVMGELVSFVPRLLEEKGWNVKTFVAHCMLAGLSSDTAYRLARGETGFTVDTMKTVAEVLGVSSISNVIDIEQ